ncbi:hypothetical protein [Actinomadura sp. KC345]|uniref:hypothetical protein n=1 Tax=Actinomadura sp. KC345 TaxID=2530371 RepID=UPI0026C54AD9
MPTHEREITEAVDLCLPSGRLNPDAVGWTRRPLHRADLRGRGRVKRRPEPRGHPASFPGHCAPVSAVT